MSIFYNALNSRLSDDLHSLVTSVNVSLSIFADKSMMKGNVLIWWQSLFRTLRIQKGRCHKPLLCKEHDTWKAKWTFFKWFLPFSGPCSYKSQLKGSILKYFIDSFFDKMIKFEQLKKGQIFQRGNLKKWAKSGGSLADF